MKKTLRILAVSVLAVTLLTGCSKQQDDKTIKVGASPSPHAEILKQTQAELEKLGYKLEIVEFVDYVQPNVALESGDLDANFFQHKPFLDTFNEKNGAELVSAGTVHFEPIAIYGGKTQDLNALKDGAAVGVPNDTTNEARALQLLEAQGLIKLKDGAGLLATAQDIVENPKKLDIKEVEAAALPKLLQDVDIAVINGNYAIEAGLNIETDALALEDKSAEAAETFANIIAVKKGDENSEKIKALIKVLNSDEIRDYIGETYKGAVVPTF